MNTFLVLIQIIIAPLSFGFLCSICNPAFYREKKTILGLILNVYTNGMLLLFLLFDLVCLVFSKVPSFFEMITLIQPIWKAILFSGIILSIVVFVSFFLLKKPLINLRPLSKNDCTKIGFILLYIGISSLVVLPSNYDDTVYHITLSCQSGVIPARNELMYVIGAVISNMPNTPFIHYTVNVSFLLFFFGIYSYLFQAISFYLPNWENKKRLIESLFTILLTALLFIRGSLYTSIPQNIWNGKTMVASCILPLAFVFGFAFYNDKKITWILEMIILIPICRLFYEESIALIIILLIVTFIATIINHIKSSRIRSRGN